jgi:hypothetical protein
MTTRSHPIGLKRDVTSSIILAITRTTPKAARIFPIVSHNLHRFKIASPNEAPQFGHNSGRPEISLRHPGHETNSIAVISPNRNEQENIISDRHQQRNLKTRIADPGLERTHGSKVSFPSP